MKNRSKAFSSAPMLGEHGKGIKYAWETAKVERVIPKVRLLWETA